MFGRPRRAIKPEDKAEVPDIPMDWRRLVRYLSPYKARMALAIVRAAVARGVASP